jgi:type II secretory pathway pseudopilin PulG
MLTLKQKHRSRSVIAQGFTLVESLVLLFIFSLITVVFYETFATGTRMILEAKNRVGGVAVANTRMETIRNLDYDDIGTKRWNGSAYEYGIPSGEILETETLSVNTREYTVHTFVRYVDDEFDGQDGGIPGDGIPNDYKQVRVEVSWGEAASQSVVLVANFAPPGVETSAGGGTLSLNILDSVGDAVGQAAVHITNSETSPPINLTTQSNEFGIVSLPGAPAANQSYVIEVSKAGYYSTTTYAPYPTSAFHPVDVHGSVVEGAFNPKAMIMDRFAQLTIHTKSPWGEDLDNVEFHLKGGKKLGDEDGTLLPVYDFAQDVDSGDDAEVSLNDRSAGLYTVDLLNDADYRLLRMSTDEAIVDNFNILPGIDLDMTMTIADTSVNAVLVRVTDGTTPLQNATVHLTNALLAYDATVITDRYGQAYFPTEAPALTAGTYDLTVSATGFSDYAGTVVVGSGLETEDVSMNL